MAPVLVFDSGVGGLTVLAAARRLLPGLDYVYVADDERFPYGALEPGELVDRVVEVMERLVAEYRPVAAVIACNTASTLVLPVLRARFDISFVGTVPAIKPAAAATTSGLISVLATPGTVARDYTRDLINEFAAGCAVTLVAAPELAGEAERRLAGLAPDEAAIRTAVAPAFVTSGGARTDTVVLACTHYPLILGALARAAPWPVRWIDPAPAIARRLAAIVPDRGDARTVGACRLVLTSGRPPPVRADAVLSDLAMASENARWRLTGPRPTGS